ncbi:hypothetical protein HDU97_005543 [Phlyctochytrium planicorne]|nr:hypothetical protein HDU97_005543 [Phlyctochytrium planicorne]
MNQNQSPNTQSNPNRVGIAGSFSFQNLPTLKANQAPPVKTSPVKASSASDSPKPTSIQKLAQFAYTKPSSATSTAPQTAPTPSTSINTSKQIAPSQQNSNPINSSLSLAESQQYSPFQGFKLDSMPKRMPARTAGVLEERSEIANKNPSQPQLINSPNPDIETPGVPPRAPPASGSLTPRPPPSSRMPSRQGSASTSPSSWNSNATTPSPNNAARSVNFPANANRFTIPRDSVSPFSDRTAFSPGPGMTPIHPKQGGYQDGITTTAKKQVFFPFPTTFVNPERKKVKPLAERRIPGPAGELFSDDEAEERSSVPAKRVVSWDGPRMVSRRRRTDNLPKVSPNDIDFELATWRMLCGWVQEKGIELVCVKDLWTRSAFEKVPAAIGIVHEIKPSDTGASIIVKDPTGCILAAFHRKVLDKFPDISIGTGIYFQDFSLLRPTTEATYMNVIVRNVGAVVLPDERLVVSES